MQMMITMKKTPRTMTCPQQRGGVLVLLLLKTLKFERGKEWGNEKGGGFVKHTRSSKLIISSSNASLSPLSPSLSLSLSILLGLFMFGTVGTRYAASMGSAS